MSTDLQYDDVNGWVDEVENSYVIYLERLIGSVFKVIKATWQGRVNDWPIMVPETKPKKEKPVRKVSKPKEAPKKSEIPGSSKTTSGKGKGKEAETTCSPRVVEGEDYDLIDVRAIMHHIDQKMMLTPPR